MRLSEGLAFLVDKISKLSTITESKGHLDHPEDMVFTGGSQGATTAVNALVNTVKNPKAITIKWDGYPALIFGRGPNGKFSIMDKHMFNKKDGSGREIYSPEQFVEYDQRRGVDRESLHAIVSAIWQGLEQSDRGKGYYWGDLLFGQPLKASKDGMYHFKANPKGIAYTVDPKSEIGQMLTNKQAGIVVHQFINPSAMTTDEATSLNGTIGKLKNNSNVAIVPAKMPFTPRLKVDSSLVKEANAAISKYADPVNQLMSTAPQAASAFSNLFTVYINKRIVAKNLNNLVAGFNEYVAERPMTDSMRNKLTQHLKVNQAGVLGAFTIWIAIYKLKMAILQQLNQAAASSPVQGYLQDGTKTQEGFVSQGIKIVDRLGFSAQNLAARS
jgi:hypothetical protein